MHSAHSSGLAALAAAGVLTASMMLAAGPAAAQQRVPSLNLTPYKLVSLNQGSCLTVDTSHAEYPGWELITQPCANIAMQLFYFLRSDDTQFVMKQPLERAPVRIAWADPFDDPLHAEYNLLLVSPDLQGVAVNSGNTPALPPAAAARFQFRIEPVGQDPALTPVASPGQSFGIAGFRTIQYGSGLNFRNVR